MTQFRPTEPSRRGGILFRSPCRKQSRPAGKASPPPPSPRDGRAKPPWFVLIAAAMVVAGIVPAKSECLGSVQAVRAAHPGVNVHVTWRGGCHFVGYGRHHHGAVAVALRLPPPPPLPRARPKEWRLKPVPVTPHELPTPPTQAEPATDVVAGFAARFNAAYSPLPTGWGWQ